MLDTGDALVGGGSLGDSTSGEVIVAGMSLMGYDAMALGLNELSLGPDLLGERLRDASFPVLSANAVLATTGELVAPAFTMLDVGGYRIALIGLTKEPAQQPAGFVVQDPTAAAANCAEQVGAQADLVIVLTNLTYRASIALAQAVPGIDIIVAAQPDQLPSQISEAPGTETYVVTAEQPVLRHTGRRVGLLELTVTGEGPAADATWQSVWMAGDIPDDPAMAAFLKEYER